MTTTHSPIAVLGAGAWGTAVAILLARNGQTVHLWDHNTSQLDLMQAQRSYLTVAFPDTLIIHTDLADALQGVTDVCLVVPSHAFRTVLTNIKALIKQPRLVWGTKGLEPSTCQLLNTVVYEVFSEKTPAAVFSGPSFAKEVMLNVPTAVSLAGNDAAFLDSLSQRFSNGYFHMYRNADFLGVQLCGVVKNVMAIAVGISDGLGFGTNTRCALITRGLSEMSRLCVAMGGLPETITSLAGVGDLILTCTDNQSRNRRFGLSIGKGLSAELALQDVGQSVEGYYNAKQLQQLAKQYQVSMPIVEQVYAITHENRAASAILSELIDSTFATE